MPFSIPAFKDLRSQNRDDVSSRIGAPLVPNDIPQVLADVNAANAHLCLQYLYQQSLQYLPLTASGIWLDRLAEIYLINSDGSLGRRSATYASGTAQITAQIDNTPMLAGTQFIALNSGAQIIFETTELVVVGTTATTFPVRALTPGVAGNIDSSDNLRLAAAIRGINSASATVIEIGGGDDVESDDELRARLLLRYRQPPMSGDATDWESWCLACPGVTRAWCSPNEMGPGSVTVRFMKDDVRATDNPMTSGIPNADDIAQVRAYLDTVRPVCVRDYFVVAPIPQPLSFTIYNLQKNTVSAQNSIEACVSSMIFKRARPAQQDPVSGVITPASTIYRAWVSDAVLSAVGVTSFDLDPTFTDFVPANKGSIAVLGSIKYD